MYCFFYVAVVVTIFAGCVGVVLKASCWAPYTFFTETSPSIILQNVAIFTTARKISTIIFAFVVTATIVNGTLIVICIEQTV